MQSKEQRAGTGAESVVEVPGPPRQRLESAELGQVRDL
jgi:hypothetical protein